MMRIHKGTPIVEAIKLGAQAFKDGVSDVAPRALNIYARKEWVRGWNKSYFEQQEKAKKGIYHG